VAATTTHSNIYCARQSGTILSLLVAGEGKSATSAAFDVSGSVEALPSVARLEGTKDGGGASRVAGRASSGDEVTPGWDAADASLCFGDTIVAADLVTGETGFKW
jgi:hypothetical protein